ncbi:MAG: hypothetical protein ACK5QX_12520 [bacterium]|jgi:hypothetical protein
METKMTEAKHTPGPWEWAEDHPQNAVAYVYARNGFALDEIATLYGGSEDVAKGSDGVWGDHPIRRANARLIAAAPDLLTALQDLLDHYLELANSGDCGAWDPEPEPQVIAARAAIAKARG